MAVEDFYDKRIDIQEPSGETPDGKGGVALTWTVAHRRVKCSIQPMRAEEKLLYDKTVANKLMKIYLGVLANVEEHWRVVWGSKTFEILGTRTPAEKGWYMILDVVEVERGS